MTTHELVEAIRRCGIHLRVEGDDVRVSGSVGPVLSRELEEQRDAVVEYLRVDQAFTDAVLDLTWRWGCEEFPASVDDADLLREIVEALEASDPARARHALRAWRELWQAEIEAQRRLER